MQVFETGASGNDTCRFHPPCCTRGCPQAAAEATLLELRAPGEQVPAARPAAPSGVPSARARAGPAVVAALRPRATPPAGVWTALRVVLLHQKTAVNARVRMNRKLGDSGLHCVQVCDAPCGLAHGHMLIRRYCDLTTRQEKTGRAATWPVWLPRSASSAAASRISVRSCRAARLQSRLRMTAPCRRRRDACQ